MQSGVCLAPEALDLCQVEGKDPLACLQKVVSADLRGLAQGEIRLTLLLHPKGQFRGLFAVCLLGKEVFLLTPFGRGEELADKLNFYLRFSHCLAKFCTAPGFLLIGNGAQVASSLGLQEPLTPGTCGQWLMGRLFAETLLGLPGLFAVGLSEPNGIPQISPEEVTLSRIKVGFPAWGFELVDDVLPQEVGWGEPLVSLEKGCYIGQETAARLATYGHTTRTLVRLRAERVASMLKSLPEPLYLPGDGKAVGRITSFAKDRESFLALALIRRKEAEVGAVFNGADCRWEVTDVLA